MRASASAFTRAARPVDEVVPVTLRDVSEQLG